MCVNRLSCKHQLGKFILPYHVCKWCLLPVLQIIPLYFACVSCPCGHTADNSNLICLHFIKVTHQAVLLHEALPKGTAMLKVRWGH